MQTKTVRVMSQLILCDILVRILPKLLSINWLNCAQELIFPDKITIIEVWSYETGKFEKLTRIAHTCKELNKPLAIR